MHDYGPLSRNSAPATEGKELEGGGEGGGGGGGEVGLRFCKPRPFFETEIHYSPIYISVKSIPVFRLSEQNG